MKKLSKVIGIVDKKSFLLCLGLIILLQRPSVGFSQTSTKPKKSKSSSEKRTATLNFEDELVTGDAAQPEIMSIMEREDFNFKRLIRLRKDFLREMKKTSEDIQRGGSGN